MSIWNECFGDLSIKEQNKLKKDINKINKLVGLKEEI